MTHGAPKFATAVLIALTLASAVGFSQAPPVEFGDVRVTSALRPVLRVSPGEVRTHAITIENSRSEAVAVQVIRTDFTLDLDGQIVFHDPATQPASNAAWVAVASEVEVPARSTLDVPVTVDTPADAEPGTYWSMLLVEPAEATTTEEDQPAEGVRTSVRVRARFGVTLLTHVGEPAEASLLFRDPHLDHGDGDATLTVTLENPTAFLASAEVWLELYDDQGEVVREVQADTLRIYPTLSRRRTFELGALEERAYQAVVIADAGREAVFGVRYDLDLRPR